MKRIAALLLAALILGGAVVVDTGDVLTYVDPPEAGKSQVFAPGRSTVYVKRVTYSEIVAGSGVVAGFLTVPAGVVIVRAQWRIVEAFDDTSSVIDLNLDGGSPPNNTVCDADATAVSSTVGSYPFPNSDLTEVSPTGIVRQMILSNGATLDAVMPDFSNDGTTGIADLYIELARAVTLP